MGGKSSKSPPPPPKGTVNAQDKAILDLKNSRDRLRRYQNNLSVSEAKLKSRALAYMKEGRKDLALMVLKFRKKKMKESENVEGQLLKVMEMVQSINWQSSQSSVLKSLQQGKEMLKKMHEEMSVDDVIELMDDINEEIDKESRIGEILGRGVSLDTVDDEDCLRDIEDMARSMGLVDDSSSVLDMPDAPKHKVETFELPDVPKGAVGDAEEEGKIEEAEREEERNVRVATPG